VPGGCVGADKLRASKDVVAFVRDFFAAGKPVGVVDPGATGVLDVPPNGGVGGQRPSLHDVGLDQGLVKGRTLTSYPTVRRDIENAGGTWVDEEVVCDKGLDRLARGKEVPDERHDILARPELVGADAAAGHDEAGPGRP
jgi:protease I